MTTIGPASSWLRTLSNKSHDSFRASIQTTSQYSLKLQQWHLPLLLARTCGNDLVHSSIPWQAFGHLCLLLAGTRGNGLVWWHALELLPCLAVWRFACLQYTWAFLGLLPLCILLLQWPLPPPVLHCLWFAFSSFSFAYCPLWLYLGVPTHSFCVFWPSVQQLEGGRAWVGKGGWKQRYVSESTPTFTLLRWFHHPLAHTGILITLTCASAMPSIAAVSPRYILNKWRLLLCYISCLKKINWYQTCCPRVWWEKIVMYV